MSRLTEIVELFQTMGEEEQRMLLQSAAARTRTEPPGEWNTMETRFPGCTDTIKLFVRGNPAQLMIVPGPGTSALAKAVLGLVADHLEEEADFAKLTDGTLEPILGKIGVRKGEILRQTFHHIQELAGVPA